MDTWNFIVFLFTEEYKIINGYWWTVSKTWQNAGGNLKWTGIPSRGSRNTPSLLHATETGISSGSVGQFGAIMQLYLFKYQYDYE